MCFKGLTGVRVTHRHTHALTQTHTDSFLTSSRSQMRVWHGRSEKKERKEGKEGRSLRSEGKHSAQRERGNEVAVGKVENERQR